ncbi:hypothetical protein YC2023_009203 [Brassica napus]
MGRKELRDKDESYTESSYVVGSKFVDPRRVLQLSWQPRVFLYRGFLSEEECDHLISLRKETSEIKSGVAHRKTQLVSSEYVLDVPDPIVAGIEEKISAWTFLPRGTKPLFLSYVCNRLLLGQKLPAYVSLSENSGPIKTSTHFRCPVLKGKLLAATKLIYAKKQARNDVDSGECSDEDENCGQWAELGECKKNPVYMIGSPDYFARVVEGWVTYREVIRDSVRVRPKHGKRSGGDCGLKSMELVKQDGNDSLDMLIRRAVGKDPFLTFHRPENSPVQLFQLLNTLERPGWPLLAPLKIQLHKCDKCTREFCSPVNFRRHKLYLKIVFAWFQYSAKEKDALGAFWDELSVFDAKEILSLKNMMLENVRGESVESGLISLIENPGYTALPQYYLRAGSDLLDIIQGRPLKFPIYSNQLFSILDDASEKTFMSNEAASMQKYIFDGENGKNVLEAKNVVACASFLLEQQLIKAWLADKDAEALRCQNLLVEEEEAAQRRQAELLERKKRKKLRQKEQRVKDQTKDAKEDESTTSDEQQQSPAESSRPLSVASDTEAQRSDSIPTENSSSLEEPQVLEIDNERNGETQAPTVDGAGFGNGQNMERRSGRREMERSQYGMPNGFRGNHAPKLGGMRKNGTNRDTRANTTKVWSRKADNPKSISPDAVVAEPEQTKNSEVLIGSVSVTIGNSCLSGEHNQAKCSSEEEGRIKAVEAKPTSEQSTVEVSRPVSSQGRKVSTANGNTDKKDKHLSSTQPEVKTANHISLQFNNHEAKAFLAKRWKEAISAEHVTLVLSQETDMPGNNTHESSNGVITAARPKHRMKPEKGAKVKYVAKQKIP